MSEDHPSPRPEPFPELDASSPRAQSPLPPNIDDDDHGQKTPPFLPKDAGNHISIAEAVNRIGLKGKGKDLGYASDSGLSTPIRAFSTDSLVGLSRKNSTASVHFRQPRDPRLPQGLKKPYSGHRIRDASPPHRRFEPHVGFDNIPLGESTECNPISFTLNVRHAGYQFRRRYRTFMVGVDDNSYSDHALQWLLDELVDDGDEIVCVRVIENPVRLSDKQYQEDARSLMEKIQSKNTGNHAIGLVLEFAVGKLHSTFQHLIQIYQPSALIVGTRGRSLEGLQGFLGNRNSFSKYCLQYSPVPVVVVRPTEKRKRKKDKRAQDPSRQSYVHMLGGQPHEADSENSSVYELEPNITADEEAHQVAVAVGLPAKFDPTVKPIDPHKYLKRGSSGQSIKEILQNLQKNTINANATGRVPIDPRRPESEADESEYESEFEVTSGDQALALKKEQLHEMESNEGAALKQGVKISDDSTDEPEEEEKTPEPDDVKGKQAEVISEIKPEVDDGNVHSDSDGAKTEKG